MIRKIKAEDKEIYIKMAHDFYRMPAVDHPVPDSYLEKTFEECLKSDTYAELFILEWEGKIAGYGLIAKTFSQEALLHPSDTRTVSLYKLNSLNSCS